MHIALFWQSLCFRLLLILTNGLICDKSWYSLNSDTLWWVKQYLADNNNVPFAQWMVYSKNCPYAVFYFFHFCVSFSKFTFALVNTNSYHFPLCGTLLFSHSCKMSDMRHAVMTSLPSDRHLHRPLKGQVFPRHWLNSSHRSWCSLSETFIEAGVRLKRILWKELEGQESTLGIPVQVKGHSIDANDLFSSFQSRQDVIWHSETALVMFRVAESRTHKTSNSHGHHLSI